MLLEPKNIEIDGKKFVISKFPSMAGYEIATQLPLSAMPKVGDFAVHQDLQRKIMTFVGVPVESNEGNPKHLRLTTDALIDNHTGNWEILGKLMWVMVEYNCSFFQKGRVSSFLEDSAKNLPQWITETLIPLLQPLFQKSSPPIKNSKKSTR